MPWELTVFNEREQKMDLAPKNMQHDMAYPASLTSSNPNSSHKSAEGIRAFCVNRAIHMDSLYWTQSTVFTIRPNRMQNILVVCSAYAVTFVLRETVGEKLLVD